MEKMKFFDAHVHINPDLYSRRYSVRSLGEELKASESAAILKSHTCSTIEVARSARAIGHKVYGSIVLNAYNGGIDQEVVKSAIAVNKNRKMLIYMPTLRGTEETHRQSRFLGGALQMTEENERFLGSTHLEQEVLEILAMAADQGIPVATGHMGKKEVDFVYRETVRRNGRLILTHPLQRYIGYSMEELKDMLQEPGVCMELTILMYLMKEQTADEIVSVLNTLGTDRIIVSSDLGQLDQCTVTNGFAAYQSMLEKKKIKKETIGALFSGNLQRFLTM